ncbi:Uncharacterized protein BP5553_10646 [Venustampulla echinocandica]|uniref:Uncharacterized protein n=1 Tax=Venustampulla echinocandica TaxID=2656787 RepID=A0A370T8N5_9HELO|nr:Uncharacterized protein BP5553_10646 [Venustampulla echinocandica]RDL29781.1 Uncharacterized protein BP5553_10646 [Venustampulla echinocandica]
MATNYVLSQRILLSVRSQYSRSFQPHVLARFVRGQTQCSPLRARSISATSTAKPAGKRALYPERLIIYHAGTGRTVFLGCLKVTTIFIFTFFCIVVAPTYFYADDQPPWVPGVAMLSGVVPMVVIMYISGPFVNYIHLRLPPFARHSREMMIRYSKSLPKDAEVDITTMNLLGKPRVARMKVSSLYPIKERFGLANYGRDTKELNSKRPWWMGRAVRQFGVHAGKSQIMGGEVWGNIAATISKRSKAS